MFGMMNHLNIHICENAEDASAKGHIYSQPAYNAVEIEKVVVVRQGTVEGNSSVDLVLHDAKGNKFVVMLTGNLLKSIPC